MAITGFGFQGTVNESGEMLRFSQAMVNFRVQGSGHFNVSPLQTLTRGVQVAAGTATAMGVRVDSSDPVRLSLDPNQTNSARYDTIMLRVSWGNGSGSSTSEIVVVKGGSSPPTPLLTLQSVADCPLATVKVEPSSTRFSASHVNNIAPYGGSSELQIMGSKPDGMRVPEGTRIRCTANGDLYQAVTSTTFKALQRASSDWVTFDPKFSSSAGEVYLGNGGVSRGRYKIINGYLIGEVEARSGTDAYNWGWGDVSFTLPVVPGADNAPTDQWFGMHMYTTTGDGLMDWRVQMLCQNGSQTAGIFAPRRGDDCRISPMRAASSSSRTAGTGVPFINGGRTDPAVLAGTFRYPV